MMKCRLIPPEYGEPQRLWLKPLTLGFVILAGLFLAGGAFFQYQIRQEKFYYEEVLYPVQENIKQQNNRIRQGQALAAKQAKQRQKRPFSWPVLIVDLAVSKPDTIVVTKLSGRDNGVIIEGITASPDGAQKWQRSVQAQGQYKAAVTRMQPKGGEHIPFSLEVVCHEAKS